MLRICAALVAALLVPGAASAKELKPKFGDIDGVYYTDVAENREACRQAVQRKIYLCSQNTSFVSNTEDRKYPGCLPIFRRQAGACADHFRSEAYKCRGSGSVRIADFTGFACTVTATVVEEGDEPERREPESKTGSRKPAPKDRGAAAHLSPKCAGMGEGAKCWKQLANRRGCHIWDDHLYHNQTVTWSGVCSQGVGVGQGTLGVTRFGRSHKWTGALLRGRMHGRAIWRFANGRCAEVRYSHGRRVGSQKPC
ncbi:MAG: hypothetical protein F4027_02295 [Rhodospirillaceae bacterium]|nr:hypothetical protein [Rhodospirillaceae bacterium]MYH36578.1 hypothetical protein [Rhodospirillaceae bacterium]MYK12885.1 hypothetical protein [Rhodospirillaceae bacterium]MYK57479.1 hypothetical protein [Rhodospirillaceae bacterium]